MNNAIQCISACGCFNANLIDQFKSLHNHGDHLSIEFDKSADVDNCMQACNDESCQCCADLSCSFESSADSKTIIIKSSQDKVKSLSELIGQNCCVGKDQEKCCDGENRNCC